MMSFNWSLWRPAYSTHSALLRTGRHACRRLTSSEPRRYTSMTAMKVARSEVCNKEFAKSPAYVLTLFM